MPKPEIWRLLPPSEGRSDRHVVLSDALSRLVDRPTLWWHWTDTPTILLGAGQSNGDIDLEACSAAGVRLVKRQSGGTTVYADPELLGLDVALPSGHPLIREDVVESYRWFGQVWAEAVGIFGILGHVVSVQEARSSVSLGAPTERIRHIACFGSTSPYEVLANGRKLVGLSQIRRGGRVLLQSGVYQTFDARALTTLVRTADRAQAARQLEDVSTDLRTAAKKEIPRQNILEAVSSALHHQLGVRSAPGDWTSAELEYVARRVQGSA